MSKRVVLTVALVAAMTVGVLALTAAPPAAAHHCGPPPAPQSCAECPLTILKPDGRVCTLHHCNIPPACPHCVYECS